MEAIIAPIDKALLKEELRGATELVEASRGELKVYCLDASFPSVLREIGRLREIAFRKGGGGTGTSCDLDRFDTDPSFKFKQLVVWDTQEECIAGGYRFVYGCDIKVDADGQPMIPSAHIFRFSEAFMQEEMHHTMELSRSFVSELHQRTNEVRRSIFVLDCLFKGICVVARDGNMTDVFGKVTFYPDYPQEAFSLLTAFMKKHCYFSDEIAPITPFQAVPAPNAGLILHANTFLANFQALKTVFLRRKLYLPPILKSYMSLTSTMRYYGAAVNDDFGNVVEMGIKIYMPDLDKKRWALYFSAPKR